jgi:hypothetical protein
MITHLFSLTAMPGKQLELVSALNYAMEVMKKISRQEISLARSMGGNPLEFTLIFRAESLDEMDADQAKLSALAEFKEILSKQETLWVPGTAQQQIFRHL